MKHEEIFVDNGLPLILKYSAFDEDVIFALRFSGFEFNYEKSTSFEIQRGNVNYSGVQKILGMISKISGFIKKEDIKKIIELKISNDSLDDFIFKYINFERITFFHIVLFANFYKKALETGKLPSNFFKIQKILKEKLNFKEFSLDSFQLVDIYVGLFKKESKLVTRKDSNRFEVDIGQDCFVYIKKNIYDVADLIGKKCLFFKRSEFNYYPLLYPLIAVDGDNKCFFFVDAEIGTLCETETEKIKVVETFESGFYGGGFNTISLFFCSMQVKNHILYYKNDEVFLKDKMVTCELENALLPK